MKIDRVKLRAAIVEAKSRNYTHTYTTEEYVTRAGQVQKFTRAHTYHQYQPWHWTADRMSVLCAISAHARGRLHIQKKRMPDMGPQGHTITVTVTLKDQEDFIGEAVKEFLVD